MDKYKKIVLMTGEYQYRNYTVKDIIDLKGKKIKKRTLHGCIIEKIQNSVLISPEY